MSRYFLLLFHFSGFHCIAFPYSALAPHRCCRREKNEKKVTPHWCNEARNSEHACKMKRMLVAGCCCCYCCWFSFIFRVLFLQKSIYRDFVCVPARIVECKILIHDCLTNEQEKLNLNNWREFLMLILHFTITFMWFAFSFCFFLVHVVWLLDKNWLHVQFQ